MTAPPAEGDLRTLAYRVLQRNTRRFERRGRLYTFTVPSERAYPHQWLWDSCFHSIAWTHLDHDRARDELRALLAWQREDGFIPHVIFWDRRRAMRKRFHFFETRPWLVLPWVPLPIGKPRTTEQMQPPVLAIAADIVVRATDDARFLDEILPALARYYRGLLEQRDPDGDGLISIIAPSESGTDFAPQYDPVLGLRHPAAWRLELAMRRATWRNKRRRYDLERIFAADDFVVADALVNAVLVDALDALARLAEAAGDAETRGWARTACDHTATAMLERMWDRDTAIFWSLAGRARLPLRVATVAGLCGLLLPHLPPAAVEAIVERQLRSPQRFQTLYPAPSVSIDEPAFRADSRVDGHPKLWRGTTWINTNWLLARGLRRHGLDQAADALADASLALVRRSGFREHFNPLTGEGYGAEDFGWSTLVLDLDRRA